MKALPEPERAHILVVDDDPAAAAVTAAVLIDLGHSVIVAHSWTEALRLFDPMQTDLVLMDAVMPNVDGLKLTGLLRERSESYVPTVFLTAIRSVDLREQCIDAGADDFLHKPVDPTELRVRLKAMLRIRALTRALEDKSRELERAALTDPLTGVGNRRFFDERLAAEVSRSDRHQRSLSLLMFDIDRFRALGVSLTRLVTIPDDLDVIAREVRYASDTCDVVITSGGVGPTHDDVTLEGVARAYLAS